MHRIDAYKNDFFFCFISPSYTTLGKMVTVFSVQHHICRVCYILLPVPQSDCPSVTWVDQSSVTLNLYRKN